MSNTATAEKTTNQSNVIALVKKDTVDIVAAKVREFQERGELHFPPNYSPENAMKAAWLKLQEVTDKNENPALKVCTRDSIANALLRMVVYGLTPLKDQGYFIVYGNKLLWQNSYFGNTALWKRVTKSDHDPVAVIVYADDEFEYEIVDGEYHVTKHKQALKNIDDSKIVAAYAILTYPDGSKKTTLMTIDQIRKAWEQGQTKGKSPAHTNFPAEMAKKTVINRACKIGIKTSDDSSLKLIKEVMKANEEELAEAAIEAEIEENANQELIDVEYEVAEEETPAAEETKEEQTKEEIAEKPKQEKQKQKQKPQQGKQQPVFEEGPGF
jgi:recombination protein RecT